MSLTKSRNTSSIRPARERRSRTKQRQTRRHRPPRPSILPSTRKMIPRRRPPRSTMAFHTPGYEMLLINLVPFPAQERPHPGTYANRSCSRSNRDATSSPGRPTSGRKSSSTVSDTRMSSPKHTPSRKSRPRRSSSARRSGGTAERRLWPWRRSRRLRVSPKSSRWPTGGTPGVVRDADDGHRGRVAILQYGVGLTPPYPRFPVSLGTDSLFPPSIMEQRRGRTRVFLSRDPWPGSLK